MARLLEGKVAIVTGAGRGIGRAHALELARLGAKVLVNDLGTSGDGQGAGSEPAQAVVEEIEALGGEATSNGADVADFGQAQAMIQQAVERLGGLHILVNNAGFLRDRMFVSTSEAEWDAVIRVHLKGHFAPARHAAEYWRGLAKAGKPVSGRIINTSSGAGLQGSVGQATYSAAKAGIAALTLVQAAELGRYGVTANAIAPAARTRMTEAVFADMMKKPDAGFDKMAPENVSPLVAWLASDEAGDVTGRVFEIAGGEIKLSDGWRATSEVTRDARWEATELAPVVAKLLKEGLPPIKPYGA
ncbi:MAG: SDR family oxidoreductase [Polyangiaceae bacterium]